MKTTFTHFIPAFLENLERQSPGSADMTRKALSFIDSYPHDICVLNPGCGTGEQTIALAKEIKGYIVAVDPYSPYLDILKKHIENTTLQDKVETVESSLLELPFAKKSFDLIWSESDIHGIGFSKKINYWGSYLKNNGFLVLTEVSWLTGNRPNEILTYWKTKYPEMDSVSATILLLEKSGYALEACFVIAAEKLIEEYYTPALERASLFLNKNGVHKPTERFIQDFMHEKELYEKYNPYYGYVFYIAKKTE